MVISPSCSLTISLHKYKPSPLLSLLSLLDFIKGSNILLNISSGIGLLLFITSIIYLLSDT